MPWNGLTLIMDGDARTGGNDTPSVEASPVSGRRRQRVVDALAAVWHTEARPVSAPRPEATDGTLWARRAAVVAALAAPSSEPTEAQRRPVATTARQAPARKVRQEPTRAARQQFGESVFDAFTRGAELQRAEAEDAQRRAPVEGYASSPSVAWGSL